MHKTKTFFIDNFKCGNICPSEVLLCVNKVIKGVEFWDTTSKPQAISSNLSWEIAVTVLNWNSMHLYTQKYFTHTCFLLSNIACVERMRERLPLHMTLFGKQSLCISIFTTVFLHWHFTKCTHRQIRWGILCIFLSIVQ